MSEDSVRELQQYQSLCDTLRDGLVLLDASGRIMQVNQRFCDVADQDRDHLKGLHVAKLANLVESRETFDMLLDTIDVVMTNEQVDERRVDLPITSPTEGNLIVEARITRCECPTGMKTLVVLRDVSERVAQTEQLEAVTEQLAVLNRVLRHDIRNDMAVILGWGDKLRESVETAEEKEALERMLDHSQHVVDLTSIAGDLVTAIENEWEMELESVGLEPVIRREIETIWASYPGAEITIVGEIPPVEISANQLLGSVFQNILTNAVIHHDGDEPQIEIETDLDTDSVTIDIRDDGPGISDDLKEEVFEKGKMGLQSPGTGMGLYLVHSLVDMYGGAITIEDNEPRGTVVTITLPLAETNTTDTTELSEKR